MEFEIEWSDWHRINANVWTEKEWECGRYVSMISDPKLIAISNSIFNIYAMDIEWNSSN